MKVDWELRAYGKRLAASCGKDDFAFDHDEKSGQWRFWVVEGNVEIQAQSRRHMIDLLKDALRCCHA